MHKIASSIASFYGDNIVNVLSDDVLMTVKVTFFDGFLGFRALYLRFKRRK